MPSRHGSPAVLMEHEREITEFGGRQARRRHGKGAVNDRERVDHLPSIFEAVIGRLMHEGRALTARDLRFAARHGRRRRKDGYTPAMLMREFQLIGETIYDLLGSDILPFGAVQLYSDLKLLTRSLTRSRSHLFTRTRVRGRDSAYPHDTMGQIPAAILCIDDEEPALLLRRRVLEQAGYRVCTALTGRKGIEMFRYKPTDVVILDYWMADMDGLDVAAELKGISPKTPIIMLSGFASILDEALGKVDLWLRKGEAIP